MRKTTKGLRESSLRVSEAVSTPWSGTIESTVFFGGIEDYKFLLLITETDIAK
jgi:hypothetical protein